MKEDKTKKFCIITYCKYSWNKHDNSLILQKHLSDISEIMWGKNVF